MLHNLTIENQHWGQMLKLGYCMIRSVFETIASNSEAVEQVSIL
jgi:hypothetical protein